MARSLSTVTRLTPITLAASDDRLPWDRVSSVAVEPRHVADLVRDRDSLWWTYQEARDTFYSVRATRGARLNAATVMVHADRQLRTLETELLMSTHHGKA